MKYNIKNENNHTNISASYQFKLNPGESKIITFAIGFIYDDENIDDISNTLFSKGKNDITFRKDWNNKLPDFPYKPDTFFSFPLWLILIVIPFATLFCILGAYLPARKAAK